MINMTWLGDKVPNYGSRVRNGKTYTPIVIVNHISAGTLSSMDNWFRNPAAEASSHFGIGRDGTIHQYVRLENAAWTQGLTADAIPRATAPIIRQMGVNPNLYCISKEHEGYGSNGGDGTLTEPQFWASVWLDKYIQSEVERNWRYRIIFGPQTVIGHFQVDPIRKPFCPGPAFPWARTYSELAIAENMDLDHYEERVHYMMDDASKYAEAFAVVERIKDLGGKLTDLKWGASAEMKLLWLAPLLPSINYQGDVTAAGIAERVLELGDTAMGAGTWQMEAVRKLLLLFPLMREKGLL
ncbi:N-acetylmuramoyl-L-alanine amidase [Paenibacillus lycopersici]|uniref:N-acetylmuramoyl-L-alanine amidase n=1 Tax=Paenibacillus lycopersici TaxID=2704462 RepID=A0A6C0FV43_9BACL|nr:N-acetylmuramoyl-L-alanine amidase [Paenibacillus lycopersici]QHT60677.1 N-acetylmuramoyl-L-alanine amidase [Paenibacillus lycopersici]